MDWKTREMERFEELEGGKGQERGGVELVALCWLNPAWQTDKSVALLCSLAFGLGSPAIILAEKGTGPADCSTRKVSSLNNFAIASSGAADHCSLLVSDVRVFADSTKDRLPTAALPWR